MPFNKPIDQITLTDLQRLITDGILEKKGLDYKRQFTDDNMKLLCNLTSFANAVGGYLIYGIDEKDGIPVEIMGIDSTSIDSEKLRIENLMRDGVEPRIPGFNLHPISIGEGKSVLIVHIPRSWAAPHMVKYKGASKFYSRNSAGKYQLDVAELRTAFLLSETIAEKIRNFRIERLAKINSNEMPIEMSDAPKVVLHVIPFSAFSPYGNREFYIPQIAEYGEIEPLKPASACGMTHRFNFDGFLSYSPPNQTGNSIVYSQLFRNGIIETVESSLIRDGYGDQNFFIVWRIEKSVIEALARYIRFLSKIQIEPPFVVLLSLLGTKGMQIPPAAFGSVSSDPVDKDILVIPEILIEDINTDMDVIMRPAFDAIWNAAGQECSLSYNENGRFSK